MLQTTLPPPLTKGDLLLYYSQIVFSPHAGHHPHVTRGAEAWVSRSVASVSNIDSLNQMVTGNAGSRKTN